MLLRSLGVSAFAKGACIAAHPCLLCQSMLIAPNWPRGMCPHKRLPHTLLRCNKLLEHGMKQTRGVAARPARSVQIHAPLLKHTSFDLMDLKAQSQCCRWMVEQETELDWEVLQCSALKGHRNAVCVSSFAHHDSWRSLSACKPYMHVVPCLHRNHGTSLFAFSWLRRKIGVLNMLYVWLRGCELAVLSDAQKSMTLALKT